MHIHSSNKILLSACWVLGILLGVGDLGVGKKDRHATVLIEATIGRDSNQVNS